MKVKEGNRTVAGEYIGTYGGLIKVNNVIGLRKGKDDKKRLMFRIKSDPDQATGKRAQVPCSFVWEFDDPRTTAALGALGVDAAKLKQISEKSGVEKAITYFDEQAEEKGFRVTTYVREDGGFGGALRPYEGKEFRWRFVRWSNRDRETNKPIYEEIPSKKAEGRDGKPYVRAAYKRVWAEFVSVEGPRKGAVQKRMLAYPVVEGEDGEWELDGESSPMAGEFLSLLTAHDIPIKSLDPDKHFKDPKNGLPELEKLMLKKADSVVLEGEVKNGWLGRVKLPKLGDKAKSDDSPVDIGEDSAVDPELLSKFNTMLEKRVRKALAKSAWNGEGKLSNAGQEWVDEKLKPLTEKGIKVGKFASDKQVKVAIAYLKEKHPLA